MTKNHRETMITDPTRLQPHERNLLCEPSPHVYNDKLDAQVEDCYSENRSGSKSFFLDDSDNDTNPNSDQEAA